MPEPSFTELFVSESIEILRAIPASDIDAVVELVRDVRERGGRLFLCGSGGGAAHASHATCDFRKLAGLEAYCPSDNVAELTARVNDEGWDVAYANWLLGSRINARDCLFVFSVGGGDIERNVSPNLVRAMQVARAAGASVTGVVGRSGGALKETADCCILVPTVNPSNVTAQVESMQAVLWHLVVTHPALVQSTPRWESLDSLDLCDATGTPDRVLKLPS
ncbi:MAG TPA: SIS domain-containing protein [Actinomycetota bacterium]